MMGSGGGVNRGTVSRGLQGLMEQLNVVATLRAGRDL